MPLKASTNTGTYCISTTVHREDGKRIAHQGHSMPQRLIVMSFLQMNRFEPGKCQASVVVKYNKAF